MDITPTSSTTSTSNSLPESQILSTSPGNCSRSATDTAMHSVHELPAKLVKEILNGEFMELSKLLPKNFNILNLSQDEPLTLTKEYVSLTRYAARHDKGLGWCVYDIKFQQKAATSKSLKWSTIDRQLWLKTFTVAPSPLKEDIGVFQSGPSSPSTSKGAENRTCHNFNRGVPCARTPCFYAQKCNRSGCGKDHPGSKCPTH